MLSTQQILNILYGTAQNSVQAILNMVYEAGAFSGNSEFASPDTFAERIASATSGRDIRLAPDTTSYTGDHIVPSGVNLIGTGRNCVFDGNLTFEGTASASGFVVKSGRTVTYNSVSFAAPWDMTVEDIIKAIDTKTLTHKPTQDLQATIDAMAGAISGYKGCFFVGSAALQADFTDTTVGSYFTITCGGHPSETASTATYEFTSDGVTTIPGAVAINLSTPLDYSELLAAIVSAISTTQGQGVGGDGALDTAIGEACYSTSVGIAVHDAATAWTYFNVTISAPTEWSVLHPYKKRADTTRKTVIVYPGTYAGPIQLPENIDIVGADAQSCIISYDGTSERYATLLMDSHTSVEKMRIKNIGTDGYARAIKPNSPFYETDDVSIIHNIIETDNWCVDMAGWNTSESSLYYGITNLRVERNMLCSSNPINVSIPHKYMRIVGNTLWYSGPSTSCHAFMDDLTVSGVSCYALIADNHGRIERSVSSATPYVMTLSGSGHRVFNNDIELVFPDGAAGQTLRAIAIGEETLWVGETTFSPIEIANNRFRITYTGTASDIDASRFLYASGASRKADVVLSNNDFICNSYGTKTGISFVGANANPSAITVNEGGLGSYSSGAVSLTDATVIGHPIGLGAGLTAALLDTAFAGGSSDNRKLLVGRKFVYTNTTPNPDEIHEASTDGVTWFTAALTAAA